MKIKRKGNEVKKRDERELKLKGKKRLIEKKDIKKLVTGKRRGEK